MLLDKKQLKDVSVTLWRRSLSRKFTDEQPWANLFAGSDERMGCASKLYRLAKIRRDIVVERLATFDSILAIDIHSEDLSLDDGNVVDTTVDFEVMIIHVCVFIDQHRSF
eukprot:TRINITY_DN17282_c0_g1_i2.p1 TRINITY_DN17282_c0_g1~~TRINITY_DN17282_c0_g1_i2.p1  ORF type:complete len:110 (-),score=25.34 TRINITY_DN17282_c0_g1_i2:678-1007(-)